MKRCPQCNRVETDEALKFCRVDGATLFDESGRGEAGTAQLAADASEVHTSILPHNTQANVNRPTGPTTVLPEPTPATTHGLEKPKRRKTIVVVAIIAAIAVGLAVVVVVASTLVYLNLKRPAPSGITSIAVLPFVNASGDKETEFLSDGISETLINNFTRISTLKVTARSTAFRYKGKDIEPQQIGRELGVSTVLTGKLLQRGDTLNIQVDLINASDGVQIWGNRYEGRSGDIVNIQQRIASDVSAQLRLKLTGAQQQQIARTYTQNPEAYQHYLRGRYHWNKRTADDLKKALDEFQRASEIDPGYALAYVGLADTYLLLEEYAGTPANEVLPQSRAFAQKALQIDDTIAEAYATLGLLSDYSWQWAESEKYYQRSIELNPNYPTARHWYSIMLRDTGQFDRCYAEIKRGQELDPLSGIIGANLAIIHMVRGEQEATFAQLNKLLELNPNWYNAHYHLGIAYLRFGRKHEGVAEMEKTVALERSHVTLAGLGYAYAVAGRDKDARRILGELEEMYARRQATAFFIASVYANLGDHDQTFAWLEKSFQNREGVLPRLTWFAAFTPVRADPRTKDLLKRMGLPE